MNWKGLRLAVRGIVLCDDKLLLVNAFPSGKGPELWCAPGGGVEPHTSLPDNLIRELYEETGLTVQVGAVALVNEFHAPEDKFHQVEIFFRCTVTGGRLDDSWIDPEAVVTRRRLFARSELARLPIRPAALPDLAFQSAAPAQYDPLERMLR